jgi:hypothetical protein
MTQRRKYEPAGGVVPTDWKTGNPDCHGMIVAEVWDVSQPWHAFGAEIRARVLLLSWGNDGERRCWIDLAAVKPLPDSCQFRRWFRPATRVARLNPTVRDWNV